MSNSFLNLWKENNLQHPQFSNYFIRPLNHLAGKPDSKHDGGAAHSNFIGGLISNEEYLFTSSEDQSISMWGGDELNEILTLYPETSVNNLALSPDGKYLAAACDDYEVKLYEIPSMKKIHSFSLHNGYVSKVAFSKQGHLVSISKDGSVRVWDYEKGKSKYHLEGHKEWVYSLAVHPEKPLAITGALNSSLKIWDLTTGECIKDLVGGTVLRYIMGMTIGGGNTSGVGNEKATASAVWLPNGKVVTCAHDIVVWDENTWEVLWQSEGLTKEIKAVCYDQDRNMIITASATIDGWNADSGEKMFSQVGHDGNQIYSCHSSGDMLYTGDEKGNISTWSISSLMSGGNNIQHSNSLTGLKADFELDRIVTGSFDDSVIVWDGKGAALKQFTFSSSIEPLGAVPNHSELHIFTTQGKIIIIDIVQLKIIKEIKLDNSLIDWDGLYWLDDEQFIAYTLSYRPRLINIKTDKVTVLETLCSFTSHQELEDGIIAFSTYPTEPIDIGGNSYDSEDEWPKADILDIGFEGTLKDYETYSPLVIFDSKKMKVMHQLWEYKPVHKKNEKFYPDSILGYKDFIITTRYNNSSARKWDLNNLTSEEVFKYPGEQYGFGFFLKDEKLVVFEGKQENVYEKNLISGEENSLAIPGLDKRNPTFTPDGKYLFYRVDEDLFIYNMETKKIIFNEAFMEFRQLKFEGDKCIIGSETGQVYIFNWG